MAEPLTFQKFETEEDAEAMAAILFKHGIYSVIEQDRTLLDQNIIGRQYDLYIQLKIKAGDFPRAQQILIDANKVDLADIPSDYMLLSFSKEELIDVIAKPDEWGPYNYNVALALLQQKGVVIDEQKKDTLRSQHDVVISKPRELSAAWFLFGYGFSVIAILARLFHSSFVLWALYGFYLLPGILGIILGIFVRFTRRTLPDGARMWSFSNSARAHGIYMILLSIVALVLVIVVGILR